MDKLRRQERNLKDQPSSRKDPNFQPMNTPGIEISKGCPTEEMDPLMSTSSSLKSAWAKQWMEELTRNSARMDGQADKNTGEDVVSAEVT